MFTNIKNRFISVIAPDIPPLPAPQDYHHVSSSRSSRSSSASYHQRQAQQQNMQDKFAYARPPFLQLLTVDELRASADHNVRPIIVPRDISLLPWGTGYAECVNSGKSEWNEDQGAFCRQVLSDPSHKHPDLPYIYFGIFDGHAGYGAALAASYQFHHILHEKLVDCIDMLLPRDDDQHPMPASGNPNSFPHPSHFHKRICKDELIVGALESAFFHMDSLIAQDRNRYRDAGGCTACVSLFINGKMFVANAGDSRAVLCQQTSDCVGAYPVPFSFDHTPETERHRLLNVARLKPHLMGKHYVAMEYAKRPHEKDLGQRILCRQGTMKGWTYKTVTSDDLRMPVVTGEGKRSRLLGTLGVTRGFGDHDLLAINSGMQIKPYLTPHPEVQKRDLTRIVSIPDENNEDGDYGILVMATDGLWDVSENEAVARTVFETLAKYPTEKHRYTMVAQELVAKARGKINDSGHWRLADSKAAATVDDISVFVIPVCQYYTEICEWEKKCVREHQERIARDAHVATEARENDNVAHLMNGVTIAHVEIEGGVANDDDDDEEIVVELTAIGANKEQAHIVVEDDDDDDVTNESDGGGGAAAAADDDNDDSDRKVEERNVNVNVRELDLNDDSNPTRSALDGTNLSSKMSQETPQTSPEKVSGNKSKQQRQRIRKDKR